MKPKPPLPRRRRLRDLGCCPGILPPGPRNAITDVAGVKVGHFTLIRGDDIRTGATAILPHGGNLYRERVPAGMEVGNAFGKFMGSTQVVELGELETPIVLTNTLAVPRAADATIDWSLAQPGNQDVRSINPVVGETNDGRLNNIRKRALTPQMIRRAIDGAKSGPVAEGSIGAGTGTVSFGWKGGIGTSSRRLPLRAGGYTVGVLVQSNFDGVLQMAGVPIGQCLGRFYGRKALDQWHAGGSIVMVVATDAPLSDRNLTRLAKRAMAGLARTGAAMNHDSGDYAIAFSTAASVRRRPANLRKPVAVRELPNAQMSPLFLAAIEATEEAILNSLCMATAVTGYCGKAMEAIPLDRVAELLAGRAAATERRPPVQNINRQ